MTVILALSTPDISICKHFGRSYDHAAEIAVNMGLFLEGHTFLPRGFIYRHYMVNNNSVKRTHVSTYMYILHVFTRVFISMFNF